MKTIYWEKGEFKWWILFLCAYHFFPFITTRGSILLYIWAYVVPIAYIVLNLNYLSRIFSIMVKSEVLSTIVLLILLSCWSILIPIALGTYDFTYFSDAIMTMVKILIRMLFVLLVIIKNIPKASKETFMKYFIFSSCLYVCGTMLMLMVPAIKDVFWELVKESEYSKSLALETRYSTRYGWGGFSGFEYTFKCVLAIIFNNYLIEKDLKERKIWWKLSVTAILLIGTLFYGRIGFLFGMIVVCFLFIKMLMKRPRVLMIVTLVCGGACVALIVLANVNQSVQAWFNWAFDLFITFMETGKLQTYSTNVLFEDMLFIPKIKTILLGDGMYTSSTGTYYMTTDAGIMRTLLFGGCIFAIIRYLSLYIMLILNYLKKQNIKSERQMFLWILLLCIVFEIKGEVVFSCLPIMAWVVVMDKLEKMEVSKWKEI